MFSASVVVVELGITAAGGVAELVVLVLVDVEDAGELISR
jgi:hypothetical protein